MNEEHIIVNFTNNDFQYKLSMNTYFRDLYKYGSDIQEPYDYTKLLQYVRRISKNKLIIDVGSNHGLFTIPCAMYGYDVIGFEPVKSNFETMVISKNINSCENVTLFNYALSNKSEQTKIFVPLCTDNASMNSNAAVQNLMWKEYYEEEITSITFDDWLSTQTINKEIGFIKIDVQGFETPVIEGMVNFLSKVNDIYVYIEWDEKMTTQCGYDLNNLHNYLINLGFGLQPEQTQGDRLYYKP